MVFHSIQNARDARDSPMRSSCNAPLPYVLLFSLFITMIASAEEKKIGRGVTLDFEPVSTGAMFDDLTSNSQDSPDSSSSADFD